MSNVTDIIFRKGPRENLTSQSNHTGYFACETNVLIMLGPALGIICLLGLIGNSLSFITLQRFSKDNVATILFKVLAVTDNLLLISIGATKIPSAILHCTDLEEVYSCLKTYINLYVWPVANMIHMCSVYLMMILAVTRYIAICKPFKAKHICTRKRLYIQLIIMTLAVILFNIPRFFEYSAVSTNVTSGRRTISLQIQTHLADNYLYTLLYQNIFYVTMVYAVPLFTLMVLNIKLAVELKQISNRRRDIKLQARGTNDKDNVTLVMVLIIFIFIVCQTPAALVEIIRLIYGFNKLPLLHRASDLLLTLNSSTNFLVYCFIRRRFRKQFKKMFACVTSET